LQGKYNTLLIAVALVAGLAIGFAGSTLAFRHRLLRIPGEGPFQRMDRVLNLTPAQKAQVGEVMEDTRDKIQQARRDFQRQRRKSLVDAYIKIRSLLTPDQQKQFEREFVPPALRNEAGPTGQGGVAAAPSQSAG
jgi:Spy/CpxP family protein refolding chaperone